MNHDELVKKYETVKNKVKEIELNNAFKRKQRDQYREEVKALGFDPDKLDEQLDAVTAKISGKLKEIEGQILDLEKQL